MKNPALTGRVSLQFKLRLIRLLLALVRTYCRIVVSLMPTVEAKNRRAQTPPLA